MSKPPRTSEIALRSPASTDLAPIAVAPRVGAVVRASGVPGVCVSDGDLVAVLGGFARLLAPFLAAELGSRMAADGEVWIDQDVSPLGRRLHCVLARRGVLPARKVGRRWLVRRADMDAFISAEKHAPKSRPVEDDADRDAQEARMRALFAKHGLELSMPATEGAPKKGRR